jgi:hypothetical protein
MSRLSSRRDALLISILLVAVDLFALFLNLLNPGWPMPANKALAVH